MTAKELKQLIALIPDNFEIGYKKINTYCDNWNDTRYTDLFKTISFEPNIDIKNKRVSMFEIKNGYINEGS